MKGINPLTTIVLEIVNRLFVYFFTLIGCLNPDDSYMQETNLCKAKSNQKQGYGVLSFSTMQEQTSS